MLVRTLISGHQDSVHIHISFFFVDITIRRLAKPQNLKTSFTTMILYFRNFGCSWSLKRDIYLV